MDATENVQLKKKKEIGNLFAFLKPDNDRIGEHLNIMYKITSLTTQITSPFIECNTRETTLIS